MVLLDFFHPLVDFFHRTIHLGVHPRANTDADKERQTQNTLHLFRVKGLVLRFRFKPAHKCL